MEERRLGNYEKHIHLGNAVWAERYKCETMIIPNTTGRQEKPE